MAAPFALFEPLTEISQARSNLAALVTFPGLIVVDPSLRSDKVTERPGPVSEELLNSQNNLSSQAVLTTNSSGPPNTIVLDPSRSSGMQLGFTLGGLNQNDPFSGPGQYDAKMLFGTQLGPLSNNPPWTATFSGSFEEFDPTVSVTNPGDQLPLETYNFGANITAELKKTGGNGTPGFSAGAGIGGTNPGVTDVIRAFNYVDNTDTGGFVSYQYNFSISYRGPNQGDFGFAEGFWDFHLSAPGVSASVSGGQLTVSYDTPTGRATYTDPYFLANSGSFGVGNTVSNVPETNADVRYQSGQTIDTPNGRSGFDAQNNASFSYSFSRV